jgi:hypothetical protein
VSSSRTRLAAGRATGGLRARARVALLAISVAAAAAACADPAGTGAARAVELRPVGGDEQNGVAGVPLAEPIAVRVVDRSGSGVGGVSVAFVVTGGGGTAAPASVATGSDGRAQTTWQLGSGAGEQTLEARVGGLTGSPLRFRAIATAADIALTASSPPTLVHGQSATLTGEGFGITPSSNHVTIGGVAAAVTAATATTLQIVVPHVCAPAGELDVRVSVGAAQSNALRRTVQPAQFVDVPRGELRIIAASAAPTCLHFAAGSGEEAYLIGVQSLAEVPTTLTPALVSASVAAPPAAIATAALAAPATPAMAADATAAARGPTPRLPLPHEDGEHAWHARHLEVEQRLRAWERAHLEPLMQRSLPRLASTRAADPAGARAGGGLLAAAVAATVQVGDVVTVRVGNFGAGGTCQNFTAIDAVVRRVGQRGIWIEDTANPTGGFTADDFAGLSGFFDDDVYPIVADYFGAPTDEDGNGRVVIVATKEVNRIAGLGGFATAADLYPRAQCAGSNEGEYYYAQVPDPTGAFGSVVARENVLRNTKRLLPHEVTHIIQLGRRLRFPPATTFQSTWELEGQAAIAEELTGHARAGRTTGRNYGAAVAWSSEPQTNIWWYQAFGYLAQYFGFQSNTTRVDNAPEQCTFLGGERQGADGPCVNGGFHYYGPAWSLMRWLADQYGPSLAGGERQLHRLLIENQHTGYATLAHVTGTPIGALLADWAAALYVDDRVADAHPRLTLSSWNLAAAFDSRVESARLRPRERAFAPFSDAIAVRAGSTAYFRVSGAGAGAGRGRPATAVRISDPDGGRLPTFVHVWVVRLQ